MVNLVPRGLDRPLENRAALAFKFFQHIVLFSHVYLKQRMNRNASEIRSHMANFYASSFSPWPRHSTFSEAPSQLPAIMRGLHFPKMTDLLLTAASLGHITSFYTNLYQISALKSQPNISIKILNKLQPQNLDRT